MNAIHFQKIFEPIQIGDMTLKNRVVMAPMVDNFETEDGYPTERKRRYFEARAMGGAGLIIVGSICVDSRTGRMHKTQLLIDDDKFIPGLRVLAHTVQRQGAKVCAQVHHFGPYADSEITRTQNIAASAVTVGGRSSREMTPGEIQDMINRHVEAVVRAKRAGFDAVQIMMSAGYLLNSFLSSVTNKRRDIYGGNIENRSRICLEIVKGARERVGRTFPISAKISPSEKGAEYGIEGCFTLEEGKELVRLLVDAGISFLSVQSRGFIKTADGFGPNYNLSVPAEPGPFIPDVLELKKVVNIPMMTTGRLTPKFAEQFLRENKIDLVGVARGFLPDPEFVKKVASGALEDIAPCINCLYCFKRVLAGEPLGCSVNPAVGREAEYEIEPAERKKKVFVVGGGPAGMETARVAAQRGHEVVLFERNLQLGGQLLAAARVPQKDDIQELTHYLENQIRKLGVRVEIGKEVTSAFIEAGNPEAVIIATGGSPALLEMSGMGMRNVATAEDVLLGNGSVGESVVVIGGGMVGCEVADFLSEQGKKVVVLEMLGTLASEMQKIKKQQLMNRLNEKGVIQLVNTRCERVTETGVVAVTQRGAEKIFEADTVVLAAGAKSNDQLFEALEGKFSELYGAGDSIEPRKIAEAIDEGFRIGLLI